MKNEKCHSSAKPGCIGGLFKAAQNNKGLFLKWILPCNGLNCLPLFWEMGKLSTHFGRSLFLRQSLASSVPHLAGDSHWLHLFHTWLGTRARTQGNSIPPLNEQSLCPLLASFISCYLEICSGTPEDTYILKSYFYKVLSSCFHLKLEIAIVWSSQEVGRVRRPNWWWRLWKESMCRWRVKYHRSNAAHGHFGH